MKKRNGLETRETGSATPEDETNGVGERRSVMEHGRFPGRGAGPRRRMWTTERRDGRLRTEIVLPRSNRMVVAALNAEPDPYLDAGA